MLRELHITDVGVIDDLDIELHPGLNVLTGETGAGKTMVTVGLSLALGARASASLVREGASSAKVQARFDAPGEAGDWAEDGEVILARTVGADGRGGSRVNGQIATATALAELGSSLVEIHGQHQAQRLLSPATQTAFLDRSAGDAHLVAIGAFRETFDELRRAIAELDTLTAEARERERELDLLAYQVREIDDVAPTAGETPALAAEEARLGHVERLLDLASAATGVLGDEGGAQDAAAAALAAVREAAGLDPGAGELANRAEGVYADLAELGHDLRSYREGLQADPGRLAEIRTRLAALKGLQRKYGETDADVLAFLDTASSRLASLAGADDRRRELQEAVSALTASATSRAAIVTQGRLAAAEPLADALQSELRDLGMPGATVEVALAPLDPMAAAGAEQVELRFSAGPGQPALPLAKTASGGELSRTMLACRSVLADIDAVPTLVFDEVDAGIGGEAGLAVGRRLARLAADRQVLVVTHLPQIASFADRHLRVRKLDGVATVEPLDDGERVEELSRMLAGLAESDTARSHAQELLVQATSERRAPEPSPVASPVPGR
ncbi:MAG: repair protein RecN [Actinomycetota bacterium]|nr:repair protein RecN [Actinomycetota bacterium]